jgi:hypothetical protein
MAKKQPAPTRPEPLNPAALPIGDLARLLSKAGGREISAQRIAADVAAGAPTNADGSLHLVHYAAWLAAQSD